MGPPARRIESIAELLPAPPLERFAAPGKLIVWTESELKAGTDVAYRPSPWNVSTDRKKQMCLLLVNGQQQKDVARILNISRNGVKGDARNIYRQLGAHTHAQPCPCFVGENL